MAVRWYFEIYIMVSIITLCILHQATISYFYGAIRYIEEHIIIAVSTMPDITVIYLYASTVIYSMCIWALEQI